MGLRIARPGERGPGERRIVELKYAPHRWGDEVDEVPAAVQDQVQWQLMVTGWEEADVAVLRGGRLDIHAIAADPAYQESLMRLARWFRGSSSAASARPWTARTTRAAR